MLPSFPISPRSAPITLASRVDLKGGEHALLFKDPDQLLKRFTFEYMSLILKK